MCNFKEFSLLVYLYIMGAFISQLIYFGVNLCKKMCFEHVKVKQLSKPILYIYYTYIFISKKFNSIHIIVV